MSNNHQRAVKIFWLIVGLTLLCLIIDLPSEIPIKIHIGKINWEYTYRRPSLPNKKLELVYGLDLAGGSSLTFDADTSKIKTEDTAAALESLKQNIERRVNLFGISEANVQSSKIGNVNRLIVDLPGVENVDQANDLIGRTAQLKFMGEVAIPPSATASATIYDLFAKDTGLDGSHLVKAAVAINSTTSEPVVKLEFDAEGSKLFKTATEQLLNKRIAIFLDDAIVTAPTVNTVIPDGQAEITGGFDIAAAKLLAAQLNAGALPVPLKQISQTKVGATLGHDSVVKGIFAGAVGLFIVALFMIGNYGYLGLIADLGLIIYGLITLALYKLIPITLTFPGIVGFILSIGMAVDSNILIFERMGEEIRRGKNWATAMELGFGRAWDAIRDANACTVITALILLNPFNWNFLNSSGMIRGFAVTLLLGIVVSLFTGVIVTRNLLRVLAPEKK